MRIFYPFFFFPEFLYHQDLSDSFLLFATYSHTSKINQKWKHTVTNLIKSHIYIHVHILIYKKLYLLHVREVRFWCLFLWSSWVNVRSAIKTLLKILHNILFYESSCIIITILIKNFQNTYSLWAKNCKT